jgi:hypothetical protein
MNKRKSAHQTVDPRMSMLPSSGEWHLHMTERGSWVPEGTYDSVTAAARRIIEIERYDHKGIFFDIFIETHPCVTEADE